MVIAITTGCDGRNCCEQHINVFTNPIGNTINIPVLKDSKGNKISSNSKECTYDKNTCLLDIKNDSYNNLIEISRKLSKNKKIKSKAKKTDRAALYIKSQELVKDIQIDENKSNNHNYEHLPHD